jgi:hypothetical protein
MFSLERGDQCIYVGFWLLCEKCVEKQEVKGYMSVALASGESEVHKSTLIYFSILFYYIIHFCLILNRILDEGEDDGCGVVLEKLQ